MLRETVTRLVDAVERLVESVSESCRCAYLHRSIALFIIYRHGSRFLEAILSRPVATFARIVIEV
jgi:hypothetical protein